MKLPIFFILFFFLTVSRITIVDAYQLPDPTDPKEDYFFFYEIFKRDTTLTTQYDAIVSRLLYNNTLNETVNVLHLVNLNYDGKNVFGAFEIGYWDQNTSIFDPISTSPQYNLTWGLIIPFTTLAEWQSYAIQRNSTSIEFNGMNGSVSSHVTGSNYEEVWDFENVTIEVRYRTNGVLSSMEYWIDGLMTFRFISISRYDFQYWGFNSPQSEDHGISVWFWIGGIAAVGLIPVIWTWRKKKGV